MTYPISHEGADQLRALATTLSGCNENLGQAGSTLQSNISDKQDALGVFFDDVLEAVSLINQKQQHVVSLVDTLVNALNSLASKVDDIADRLN